jgi:DNA processing protein
MNIASELVAAGHAIITGAAYGIDGMATRATLASNGTAVVVLGGGVDRPYPTGHHDLITRVASSIGVVIVNCHPQPPHEMERFLRQKSES